MAVDTSLALYLVAKSLARPVGKGQARLCPHAPSRAYDGLAEQGNKLPKRALYHWPQLEESLAHQRVFVETKCALKLHQQAEPELPLQYRAGHRFKAATLNVGTLKDRVQMMALLGAHICCLQETRIGYFRKPLWAPPDPESPKTPRATKKEIPKTQKVFENPFFFPKRKRSLPKSKRYLPKVNAISPKENVRYFKGNFEELKVLKFSVGGSPSQGFRKYLRHASRQRRGLLLDLLSGPSRDPLRLVRLTSRTCKVDSGFAHDRERGCHSCFPSLCWYESMAFVRADRATSMCVSSCLCCGHRSQVCVLVHSVYMSYHDEVVVSFRNLCAELESVEMPPPGGDFQALARNAMFQEHLVTQGWVSSSYVGAVFCDFQVLDSPAAQLRRLDHKVAAQRIEGP